MGLNEPPSRVSRDLAYPVFFRSSTVGLYAKAVTSASPGFVRGKRAGVVKKIMYAHRMDNVASPRVVRLAGPAHSVLGELRVAEPERAFGFIAKRFYWIEGVPETAVRGHHAHKRLQQAIILVRGKASVNLRTPENDYSFSLADPGEALLVPPGFWREMSDFSADALMMVFASELYDEADYIRDWDSYVEFWRS